jgi:hypothetical protein
LKEKRRLRVFENKVLRRILVPKRDEVTGVWRKLHNEELYHLHSSLIIFWVLNSRRMRWAGYVARIGREEACTGFWLENLRERNNWVDPGVDRTIILRSIFKK